MKYFFDRVFHLKPVFFHESQSVFAVLRQVVVFSRMSRIRLDPIVGDESIGFEA